MSSSRSHHFASGSSSGGNYRHKPAISSSSGANSNMRLPPVPSPQFGRIASSHTGNSRPLERHAGSSNTRRRSPSPPPPSSRPGSFKRYDEDRDRKMPAPTPASSARKSSPHERERERKSDTKPKGSLPRAQGHSSTSRTATTPSSSSSKPVGRVLPGHMDVDILSAPEIIRRILHPDDVKIPRRKGEGSKPIFAREELREGIEKRMKSDDNEKNPEAIEQRVVAIIREPVVIDPYSAATAPPRSHSTAEPVRNQIQSSRERESRRRRESPPSQVIPTYPVQPLQRSLLEEERLAFARAREQVMEMKMQRPHIRSRSMERSREEYAIASRHERRSRSRSPLNVRRVSLERAHPASLDLRRRDDRDRDLRETLSRPSYKPEFSGPVRREVVEVAGPSDIRTRGFNRGFPRGRGGTFNARSRVYRRPVHLEPKWQHDKYDRQDQQLDSR